jgi:catechol 2,3-dioxygenase-like lactoylglutathione lyase family enzyme
MLTDETLVAFATTTKPQEARAFYEGVLGLTFVSDGDHLMVFGSGPARVSLAKVEAANVRPGTTLGWEVRDLRSAVRDLISRGVTTFDRSGPRTDDLGIWSPIPGFGVAWFKDPDGHTLSVSGPILQEEARS